MAFAGGIGEVLDRAATRRPMLLHGFDTTVWHFLTLAAQRRWSTRVGLEDGNQLANGAIAASNATLTTAAVGVFRKGAGLGRPAPPL